MLVLWLLTLISLIIVGYTGIYEPTFFESTVLLLLAIIADKTWDTSDNTNR